MCISIINYEFLFDQSAFLNTKISNKALREYRASSVDRALCEEALTLLTLLLQYLLNTYLDSKVFSV